MNTLSKPYTPHPYIFAGLSNSSALFESNNLLNSICEHLQISRESVNQTNRTKQVRARFYFTYIHKYFIGMLTDGKVMEFLDRDRTTFYHSIKRFQDDLDTNSDIKKDFESFLLKYNQDWYNRYTGFDNSLN